MFALRLRDALVGSGKDARLDENKNRGGEPSQELQRAIRMADAFLFLRGPHSRAARDAERRDDRTKQLLAGLASQENGWRRVVIEKPFGHDLPSAKALNTRILKVLSEDQIYRIDHFLGKETVQNIMALRFANGLFEPIWNRDRIDHVQITVAESIGIGTRGSFTSRLALCATWCRITSFSWWR